MKHKPFPADVRREDRIPVHVPVIITTVLASAEAEIIDLTEYGALIAGPAPRKGTQFQIEYQGQTVFGFVIWEEGDRFGARFPFELHDGPLYRTLEQARIAHRASDGLSSVGLPSLRAFPGFGRRTMN